MELQKSILRKIKIDNTDVFLEDYNLGEGKITISNTYGLNYSYYWGAMGDNLSDFIKRINSDYFAQKLIPVHDERVLNVKKTFANLRKYIKEELDMPFYKEMVFQQDMREKLNRFQNECEEYNSGDFFVNTFNSYFIDNLDFYLIEDDYDMKTIKEEFHSFSEVWGFISEKPSDKYLWLKNLHKKLIKLC